MNSFIIYIISLDIYGCYHWIAYLSIYLLNCTGEICPRFNYNHAIFIIIY